jgi:hypothetical protein
MTLMVSNDGWLVASAPLSPGSGCASLPENAWELLAMNRNISGAAKIVLAPGERVAVAVREVWLETLGAGDDMGPEAVAAAVRRAVNDLEAATGRCGGKHQPRRDTDSTAQPRSPVDCDPGDLCQSAGWPCNRRADGTVTVPLEVRGGHALAILQCDQRLKAGVELPIGVNLSAPARQAVGLFLLELGGIVRSVRTTADIRQQSAAAVLEAQLDGRPSAAAMQHLLAPLSVAAQMAIRELPLLSDDAVAAMYLSIRGWSSRSFSKSARPEMELSHEQ